MVKPFKSLLLQNQKADNLRTWYVTFGMGAYQGCSHDDPRLPLTYLTSRSNSLSNASKFETFEKLIFLNTVEAKVIIFT